MQLRHKLKKIEMLSLPGAAERLAASGKRMEEHDQFLAAIERKREQRRLCRALEQKERDIKDHISELELSYDMVANLVCDYLFRASSLLYTSIEFSLFGFNGFDLVKNTELMKARQERMDSDPMLNMLHKMSYFGSNKQARTNLIFEFERAAKVPVIFETVLRTVCDAEEFSAIKEMIKVLNTYYSSGLKPFSQGLPFGRGYAEYSTEIYLCTEPLLELIRKYVPKNEVKVIDHEDATWLCAQTRSRVRHFFPYIGGMRDHEEVVKRALENGLFAGNEENQIREAAAGTTRST